MKTNLSDRFMIVLDTSRRCLDLIPKRHVLLALRRSREQLNINSSLSDGLNMCIENFLLFKQRQFAKRLLL